jgi:hypothetical protein
LKYMFDQNELNMRHKRWLEFFKDDNFKCEWGYVGVDESLY